MTRTAIERFVAKIEIDANGCWLWQGFRSTKGYGQFGIARNRPVLAHRWSYGYFVGPIPAGLQIDHLCRVEPCVNPDHLEAVTSLENNHRSLAARGYIVGRALPVLAVASASSLPTSAVSVNGGANGAAAIGTIGLVTPDEGVGPAPDQGPASAAPLAQRETVHAAAATAHGVDGSQPTKEQPTWPSGGPQRSGSNR